MSVSNHINLGLLELQVLWLLGKSPMHGYALMRELSGIKQQSITQGTLYPLLSKLLRKKLVSSTRAKTGGRFRKTYQLTALGKSVMEESCRQFVQVYSGVMYDYGCSGCSGAKHSAVPQYMPIGFAKSQSTA